MQLLQLIQVVKPIDLIIVEPELLQGACEICHVRKAFQLVAIDREDFEALKLRHGYEALDCVRGDAELFAHLKLVDGLVEAVNRSGQLAHEVDIERLIGYQAMLLLPHADGFAQR